MFWVSLSLYCTYFIRGDSREIRSSYYSWGLFRRCWPEVFRRRKYLFQLWTKQSWVKHSDAKRFISPLSTQLISVSGNPPKLTQPFRKSLWTCKLLVPRTEHHLSSFKYGFLNILRAKTCCVVCHAYCFCYDGTNMAQKNVWKTTFHSTFQMIQLQPISSRKNNRKTFEGVFMEATSKFLTVWYSQFYNTLAALFFSIPN